MRLEHITKIYHNKNNDIQALDDVSLEISHTGLIFILGPSGSGKSTISRIINGLDKDYSGRFIMDGVVEYVEQEVCLFENMSVLDNLKLISHEDIQIYLDMFDMSQHQNKLVKNLSVGQKKRVQIIRSLLVSYDYLLLDEPTASLDEENTDVIMNVLKQISKKHTVIIITHEKVLNEKYGDRSIYLKGGHIDKDIVHRATSSMICDKHLIENKNNIPFQLKRILRSIPLQSTKFIIVSIMVLSFLVFNSFFFSIEGNIEERNRWLSSDNIIVTQPINSETQRGDLYDSSDIQKVKDNIDHIIGYQIGWSAPHISYSKTITPGMTLNDIKDAIKEEEERHQQTNEPYKDYYYHWKSILEEELEYEKETGHPIDEDFELTGDYRAYEGFSRNDNGDILRPNFSHIRFDVYENETAVYQIFNMASLDLQYGKAPVKDNEVIVDTNLASQLCKQYNLSSPEDLLDQEYDVLFVDLDNKDKVKITGIAYQQSQYEQRVFFKAGAYDRMLSKNYHFNDDQLKYNYIYFISDASIDSQNIANQINQLLSGKHSTFVSYPDSVLNTSTTVVSSYSTLSYVVVGLMVVVVIGVYMLVLILQRKRYCKEVRILKHYHQSILLYVLLPTGIIFLLDIMIYSLLFDKLCTIINTYANHQGYSELIQNSPIIIICSLIFTIIITLLMEGIFYVYQTKKYSKTV